MTQEENATPPPEKEEAKTKWSWPRRFFVAFLLLLLVAVFFHRPLIQGALRQAVIRGAATQNLEVDLQVGGNLFNHLSVHNLRAVAKGPSPVERANIRFFEVHYNLWDLIRTGPTNLISSYRLEDADIVVTLNKATEAQKIQFNRTLRGILQQPALFSDTIEIHHLNLVAHQPEGDLVVADLNLSLHPNREGVLNAKQLIIPDVAEWQGISATTSYVDRHLAVSNLQLGPQIQVSQVVLDSSHRAQGINYLSFRGTLFGGEVALFLWQKKTDTEDYAKLTASVDHLSLKALRDFLKLEPVVEGELTKAWIDVDGSPDLPHTWRGQGGISATDLSISSVEIGDISTNLSVRDGIARIEKGAVVTGKNRIAFQSEYQLPQSTEDLFTSGIEADLAISVTEPGRFYPGLKEGNLQGKGRLTIDQRELTLTLDNEISGLTGDLNGKAIGLGKGASHVSATYRIAPRDPGTPWFDGLKIDNDATFHDLRFDQWKVERATLKAGLDEARLTVSEANLRQGENSASFQGDLTFPRGPFRWEDAAFNLRFDLKVPSLAAFNAEPEGPDAIHGVVSAEGAFVKESAGEPKGDARIEATRLSWRGFQANRLAVTIPVHDQQAEIVGLELDINGTDRVTGRGSVGLHEPFPYEGELTGSLSDLSIFSDLLGRPLSGALRLDWRGSGELRRFFHEGRGFISVQEGAFPPLTGVQVEIAGAYSPETINIPKFRIAADQGSIQTVIGLRDQRLSLNEIAITIANAGSITGYFQLPLDLRTLDQPETILPKTGTIDGKLTLERISIAELTEALRSLKNPEGEGTLVEEKEIAPPKKRLTARPVPADEADRPSLSGFLDATLVAKGTVGAPELALALEGSELRALATSVDPSHVSARLLYRDDRLALDGSVAIPGLNPLLFTGEVPLPLQQTIDRGGLDPATPVRFSIRLPRSSATVLTRFTPALRYIEGSLAIDASVGGTLEAPTFRGGLTADLPAIRFAASNFPGISDFRLDLQFANNVLSFRRFEGSLAGGPFRVMGGLGLKDPANPEIDLHLQSDGTLLLRNDSVTVRADSDIRIRGPFKTAAVTGNVGIRRSRFFRDIQIIPIGLPGNAAPKPAQGPSAPPSITAAPFRDWTLDIAIKTTEPFIVRSNLANGRIYTNLQVGGTGLAPTLEGIASIRGFVASLPFSTLNIDYGYVYFTAGDPFNPTLDISGTSRLRNYNIHAYIYGTAENPETVFTSQPPLPQEEIVALLATGATTSEFSDNSELLASRAAFLLLQDLYRKVFKRKSPPPTVKAQNDFADRFKFDVGSVDPRTGRQQIGGSFRVTDQVEVGAGIDLEGDARAEVRYLIRFR
ncbi:MAG TPA: translocation/assembly module TamB domain-containing protein [Chthoniobacteraceae bacterium]|nr:translocation/assembly module TamB domain-containing protein [Chthoniobacteraceae bacterium]